MFDSTRKTGIGDAILNATFGSFNEALPAGQFLAKGARGPAVVVLQKALKEAGCDPSPGKAADGIYGNDTFNAVKCLQRKGNSKVIDGKCGQETWAMLNNILHPEAKVSVPAPGVPKDPTAVFEPPKAPAAKSAKIEAPAERKLNFASMGGWIIGGVVGLGLLIGFIKSRKA